MTRWDAVLDLESAGVDGFDTSVKAGWDWFAPAHSPPSVRLGQMTVPAAFTLTVFRGTVETPEWVAFLGYLVDEASGEISLAGFASTSVEADVALAEMKKAKAMGWWKRHALVRLVFDQGLNALPTDAGAEHLDRLASRLTIASELPVTRRRDRVTDAHLREVAQVYRSAWQAGNPPTAAVAGHFFKSHSTAARWVGQARKAGHLGPAESSKGGERAASARRRKHDG